MPSPRPRITNSAFFRLVLALLVGTLCFLISLFRLTWRGVEASDFSFPLRGAARLRAGLNPYHDASVGLFRPYPFQTGFPYPLPAAVLVLPFTLVGGSQARLVAGPPSFSAAARSEAGAIRHEPNPATRARRLAAWERKYAMSPVMRSDWRRPALAGALFVGVASALLAAGLLFSSRASPWYWGLFFSPAYWVALGVGQWSPLLVAGHFLVPLLFIGLAKPTIALPLLVHTLETRPCTRRQLVWLLGLSAALLVVSFALLPSWPAQWVEAVRAQTEKPYFSPFLSRPGFVLLPFALWQLRQRGGKLLCGMGLVPQHSFFYDSLPLLLLPRSTKQMVALLACQWLGYGGAFWLVDGGGFLPRPNLPPQFGTDAIFMVSLWFYAPAVALLWWQARQDRRASGKTSGS